MGCFLLSWPSLVLLKAPVLNKSIRGTEEASPAGYTVRAVSRTVLLPVSSLGFVIVTVAIPDLLGSAVEVALIVRVLAVSSGEIAKFQRPP
jgi:hypothetical protein